ncbi:solute carrier family 26 member 10-like protein [Dinothrombium tinctorium]|uniref:Solute carrier family 26 member 10-like protein n=1 Tax=Dinothrombium tinctorium TaxID=1965070 RepID=A0A3S3QKH6_9ACAR|nr:solute carrier family 26 member 10-like protein [Dinothrombium tinctorium]RWS10227.1 solute carrier family 26 member 10-like protein [Dinothrombium tinctorium]RWS12770.1 solute carrier family 26 member 10-like protein [Dinothrombium tinctorium]
MANKILSAAANASSKRDELSDDAIEKYEGIRSNNNDCRHVSMKDIFYATFPLFDRLRTYSRDDLITDIIAGLTLSILHIPQAIAYSLLIGVGPIYGLYSSFFPVLIYAFMGTAQHISIGTIAVVDIILAEIVKKFSFESFQKAENATVQYNFNGIHVHKLENENLYAPHSEIEIMTSVCFLTGLIQIIMGILKMGAVSLIFSDQLVSGFSCAASFHVAVSQLPNLFDIKLANKSAAPFHLVVEIIAIGKQFLSFNRISLIIVSVVFTIMILFKELMEPYIKRRFFSIPVPIDLIIVVTATLLSKYFLFNENYAIKIIGEIPTGLPTPQLPRLSFANLIIIDSISIALITYAFALSLGKIYAKQHGYTVRPNQEFFALGTANAVSAFFGCFATTASLSRTSTMGQHAKTQFCSIVSCAIILLVMLYFSAALYHLPKCVIAVIIIYSQKPLILEMREFSKAWNISRYEGGIWIVTFACVILLGIYLGLLAGVVFSVLTIVLRFYSPKLRLLGQLPNSDIYLDIRQHPAAREIFGIKILQFSSPLFFMNKDMFQESVCKKALKLQKFKGHPWQGKVEAVVIDCSSMSFVDSSAVETLSQITNELNQRGVEMALAAIPPPVISFLTRSDFFYKSPNTAIYPSVHEAVMKVTSPKLAKNIDKLLP